MKRFEAVIPFPVSVNDMHFLCRGGLVLSTKTRDFYAAINKQFDGQEIDLMTYRLRATVYFHESDKKRRDINNYTKTLFDAFEGIVYKDDRQIDETVLYRAEIMPEPCCRVIFEEICEDDERVTIKKKKTKKEQDRKQKDDVLFNFFGEEACKSLNRFNYKIEKSETYKITKREIRAKNKKLTNK